VPIVTQEELADAIRHTLVARGKIPPERAEPMASVVLSYFGTEETVLDNVVSAEDRDAFYTLEEEGLLTSEEEDAQVARGKTWRIHYWLLKTEAIKAAARPPSTDRSDDPAAVYQQVSPDEWTRRDSDPKPAPPA